MEHVMEYDDQDADASRPAKLARTESRRDRSPGAPSPSPKILRPGRRVRVRGATACESCRGKRIKCDNQYPKCASCIKTGAHCSYLEDEVRPHAYVMPFLGN